MESEPEEIDVVVPRSLPLVLGRGLFADNASGLRQTIYRCTNRSRLLGYSIVIMGLDRPPAGRPYIAFQLEQLRSEMVDEEFVAVLRGAAAVWDFSILHTKHWREMGMPARHMPLWYTLPRSAVSPPCAPAPASLDDNEQIDVLLFGSMNVRREVMGRLLEDAGLRVVFKRFNDYDEQLHCIRRAAVVANIHYHEDAALEVHRIDPLLAAGKCVLSEYSSDAQLDALYMHAPEAVGIGTVMFASYDDFVAEAVRLLASATRREAMSVAAKRQMWERHSGQYPQQLHDALDVLPRADAEACVEQSEASWQKWASNATGRAQFSQAISLVQGWAESHNVSNSDDTKINCTGNFTIEVVEAVIDKPGKIGIRLEAASENVRPQIAAIVPGSQASKIEELRVGMMLVAVQGAKVEPGRQAAMTAIAAAGRPLRLLFQ